MTWRTGRGRPLPRAAPGGAAIVSAPRQGLNGRRGGGGGAAGWSARKSPPIICPRFARPARRAVASRWPRAGAGVAAGEKICRPRRGATRRRCVGRCVRRCVGRCVATCGGRLRVAGGRRSTRAGGFAAPPPRRPPLSRGPPLPPRLLPRALSLFCTRSSERLPRRPVCAAGSHHRPELSSATEKLSRSLARSFLLKLSRSSNALCAAELRRRNSGVFLPQSTGGRRCVVKAGPS